MKITIIRHGKPIQSSERRFLNGIEFEKWVKNYDRSGIHPEHKPGPDILERVKNAEMLYSSTLPRSWQSAQAIDDEKVVLMDPLFREAETPAIPMKILKLSPVMWWIVVRILWFLGYTKNAESLSQTRHRAKKAVRLLTSAASQATHVVLVGHAFFNTFIEKELKREGWIRVASKDRKWHYWNFSEYIKKAS